MDNYLYGKNSFTEALKNNRIKKAYVLNRSSFIDLLKKNNIKYEIVDKNKLDKLSNNKNHQGIVAETYPYKLSNLDDILKQKNGLIVMLDGLTDPQNFGSIIRTCECAGVDGIIYKKNNSVKVNDTVLKVASGAADNMKIVEVVNLVNTIEKLKEMNYWIVGTSLKTDKSYTDIDYNSNIVLVIGSEDKGISRLVSEKCDYLVKIDMKGKIDSLNVSVATGVLLFNINNSRNSY